MSCITFTGMHGHTYHLFHTVNSSAEENNSIKNTFNGRSWKGEVIVFRLEAEKYANFQPDDFDSIVPFMTLLGENMDQFPNM